jgi:3-hydroxyanthranilate 3,4-dioxygenase
MRLKSCFINLEGSIKIITKDGQRNVLELHAGDMYLHPASTSFPSRSEGSIVWLLNERAGQGYTTVYYGFVRTAIINYEVYFELNDIEKIYYLILKFYESLALRIGKCGQLWKQTHDLRIQ